MKRNDRGRRSARPGEGGSAQDPQRLVDLVPDPTNRRTHGDRNTGMMADALRAVGAARSIVIDERGEILAGNGLVQAARAVGLSKLQVVDADGDTVIAVRRRGLTAAQKRSLAIYDNRASELAEWNVEQLRLDAVNGLELQPYFFTEELTALFGVAARPGRTDPDAVPAARPTTPIVRGDLFALGRHRLLCGDATAPADVARVLGPDPPLLMVTDPPYGVDYDPAWRAAAGVNRNTKKMGPVTNDGTADWRAAWVLFPGAVAYIWHAGIKSAVVAASLEDSGFELRAQIIWAKDRMALSRGDYHWQHEPCWYAVRAGAAGHRTEDRTQTTLWPIPAREDSGHGHGTQKPVECMRRPIQNHGGIADAVYDPFCGSGTTLIAAEQLTRRCVAIEIEPLYVQIAIDRWEAFTGNKAHQVAEGGAA